MEPHKGDQRVEESEKATKPAALLTENDKKPAESQGNDQSAVPAITKDLVRMIESSQDGRLDLKSAAEELKAPRSTVDFVSSLLEGIQFFKRISSDIVQMMNISDRDKLTKWLEESWTEGSTVDEWISQLKSLRFSSPDEKEGEGEKKSSETKETPDRAQGGSTTEEPQTTGMRTLLSPYPITNSSPSSTTSSTSYPRPARRRTTPVYIFGQSTPFKKQFTPADRLVQVSSEDTDESNPSSKSDSTTHFSSPASNSNFSTPESLPHPLSPAATMRNARSRVLLLDSSPDHHDSVASSRGKATKKSSSKEVALSPAAAAAAKTAQAAVAASNLKHYDLNNKKRVPSFVSKQSSADEVSKRPKK